MPDNDPLRDPIRVFLDDFRDSIGFLTVIPATALGSRTLVPDFRRAARTFPLVGVLVGLAAGLVAWLATAFGLPPLLAATLAVLTTMVLTGAFHEDGLADTADAFGGTTIERKLEIMKDSRIGAFGVLALVFSVLLRIGAIAAVIPAGGAHGIAMLVAAEGMARAAMVRLWHDLPAARSGGLSERTGPPEERSMLVALILAGLIVALTVLPIFGLKATVSAVVLAVLAGVGFTRLAAAQIGGRTGDTLGACQQVVAVAAMLAVIPFA